MLSCLVGSCCSQVVVGGFAVDDFRVYFLVKGPERGANSRRRVSKKQRATSRVSRSVARPLYFVVEIDPEKRTGRYHDALLVASAMILGGIGLVLQRARRFSAMTANGMVRPCSCPASG